MGSCCCGDREVKEESRSKETLLIKCAKLPVGSYNETFEEASKIFSKLEEIRVELQQTTNNMLSTFGIDEKRTTGVCEAIVGFIWSVAANYAKQEKSELFSCRIERLPPYFHITFEEVDRDRRELYVFKENLFKYIDIITEKEQTVSVLLGQLEELMYKMTEISQHVKAHMIRQKAEDDAKENLEKCKEKKLMVEDFHNELLKRWKKMNSNLEVFKKAVDSSKSVTTVAMNINKTNPKDLYSIYEKKIADLFR